MSNDYRQSFQRLAEKTRLVVQHYEKAIGQRDEALQRVAQLENELLQHKAEIEKLKVEIENITVVKTAFPSKQTMAESRKYLSGLVREIDQYIKDLTS